MKINNKLKYNTPALEDDVVLRVEHLSKKFCRTLKRSMFYGTIDIARSMTGINYDTGKLRKDEFWALDDVSFELKKGETLGIIGVNGSGKSTLLRLVTGIFPPDKGRISFKGRIGALIAVGAGFHPYMTGRENIYLNGTILGMTRKELNERLDEIIDFAEIGEFLDAPVNTYSSGMRVRLGFAIAVHCEPDILLVDEVLSVGDLNFKAKCIQKIEELRATVSTIFISHNMFQIDSLCSKALLMDKGTILSQGDTRKVINDYYNLNIGKDLQMNAETTIYESIDGLSDVKIEFTTDKGRVFFYPGDNVKIKFSCNSEIEEENLVIDFSIKSMEGLRLITQKSTYKSKTFKLKKGYNEFCCTLGNIPLLKGSYSFLFNFRGLLDNRIVSGSGPNLSVFNRNDDVPDTGTVDSIVIWD